MTVVAEPPVVQSDAPSDKPITNPYLEPICKLFTLRNDLLTPVAGQLLKGDVAFSPTPLDLKLIGTGVSSLDLAHHRDVIVRGKGEVLRAQYELARGNRVNPLREAAFRAWLSGATGLLKGWPEAMVAHLHPRVTYVRFFAEQAKLLVEYS